MLRVRGATAAVGAANVTPALPTGWAADDIFLLICETNNGEAATAPDGTWTQFTGSPITSASQTRLTAFWKRATGSETAPTIIDPGDHCCAELIAIAGAVTTGDPWESVQTGSATAATTAVTWPSVTPSTIGHGLIHIVARGTDSAADPCTVMTCPNGDLTTRFGDGSFAAATTGGGGGVKAFYHTATAATAIVATGTMPTTDHKALMSLVLIPADDPYDYLNSMSLVTVLEQEPGSGFIAMNSMGLVTVLEVGEEPPPAGGGRRRNFMFFVPS